MDSKRIVVVGDIMMDEYIYGDVNRVSPESCCPILQEGKHSFQLGGAANVAFQIRQLGAEVSLVGVVGNDSYGDEVLGMLKSEGIDCENVFIHNTKTTCKKRYINHLNQQMFRSDIEEPDNLSESEMAKVLQFISSKDLSCITISDYNKGVVSNDVCQEIINQGRKQNIIVLVDIKEPKIKKYHGATFVKGNKKEVSGMMSTMNMNNINESMISLREELGASVLVMTCGGEGIIAVDEKGNRYNYPAEEHYVFDVTGAGDIVTAYCSYLISNNYQLKQVLYYANKAANIKVERFGNSHVGLDEIFPECTKIISLQQLKENHQGKRIVFTNGCFDIVHAGHIDMLQKAKLMGDILVVAVNSDESARKLKGNDRPYNTLDERIKVLSAIACVDYIIPFEELTPIHLIEEIHPSVLVKGGDYTEETIVGADFVRSYGGEVSVVPFTYNTSSSKLIKHVPK